MSSTSKISASYTATCNATCCSFLFDFLSLILSTLLITVSLDIKHKFQSYEGSRDVRFHIFVNAPQTIICSSKSANSHVSDNVRADVCNIDQASRWVLVLLVGNELSLGQNGL